jgi:hypothetical protein
MGRLPEVQKAKVRDVASRGGVEYGRVIFYRFDEMKRGSGEVVERYEPLNDALLRLELDEGWCVFAATQDETATWTTMYVRRER